jgi:hypothetical protein
MNNEEAFTKVDPALDSVLDELKQFEPIFHTQAFGLGRADFERRMSDEYWEVGASGRRYCRAFILDWLEKMPPVDADVAGWKCRDWGLHEYGQQTYLVTYTLHQGERVTRRATVWRKSDGCWRILYHQGTIVSVDEVNSIPA